jgi:hypothetical protein
MIPGVHHPRRRAALRSALAAAALAASPLAARAHPHPRIRAPSRAAAIS